MKAVLFTLTTLFAFTNAQGSGRGISKFTRGQNNPIPCLNFFNDILGGTTATDECQNNKCECATQGRSQICPSKSQEATRPPPGPPSHSSNFGAHAINCTYHPYGEQSLHQTEVLVDAEVGDWFLYNQHMDSHVGIWTNDLSGYVAKIEKNGNKYIKLTWEQNHQTYYSVVGEACPGFFFELISDVSQGLTLEEHTFVNEPRLDTTTLQASYDVDTVVKVSRATTRIDEMIDFYTNVIGGSQISKTELDDGTIWAIVKLDHADAELHFVNRPAPQGSKFSVADLEDMVNSVHDKYVKSTNCGFDQYADHHWAYDCMQGGNTLTLSAVSKRLEEGGHKYRWFGLPGGNYQIYAFDPSGWTLQLDLSSGSDVPSTTASYSAACKSDDGCYGQGLCDDVKEGQFFYATKTWEYFLN